LYDLQGVFDLLSRENFRTCNNWAKFTRFSSGHTRSYQEGHLRTSEKDWKNKNIQPQPKY